MGKYTAHRPIRGHKRKLTDAVEIAIANGVPNSAIMEFYGISYTGLQRIKKRMARTDDRVMAK